MGKGEAGVSYDSVVTRNRFQVLEDEVSDEPGFTFIVDSLIRHQDIVFCRKRPKRKHV